MVHKLVLQCFVRAWPSWLPLAMALIFSIISALRIRKHKWHSTTYNWLSWQHMTYEPVWFSLTKTKTIKNIFVSRFNICQLCMFTLVC